MICLNCGKHVDDEVRVCPFCGALIEAEEASPAGAPEEDPLPINISRREAEANGFERIERSEPVSAPPAAPAPKAFPLLTVGLAVLSLVLGLLCLTTVLSLRSAVRELTAAQTEKLGAIDTAIGAVDERLDKLDATLANVQSEAYEQVASQSISLIKDLTPLVGPVDEGKYNRMFIVTAKGNLNRDTSFVWQRYNEATGGWVEIVFTGDATTNEQYGLRLENQFDGTLNEYTTILWANGITQEAAGTYRCLIVDETGITKTSAEATVEIAPAE